MILTGLGIIVLESYLESFKGKHQSAGASGCDELESYLESFKGK